MAYMSMMNGNIQDILPGNNDDYVTAVDFILDISPSEVKQDVYKLDYDGSDVEILIKQINEPQEDPIMQIGKDWNFGVSGRGVPNLPFSVFTDNRGKYPCILARVVFPYRLSEWIDPNHPAGIKMDHNYEDIEILGIPQNKEKIEALKAINKLFKSGDILNQKKSLTYDDVTVFNEVYYKKGVKTPSLVKLTALASKTAYKDAIEDYYLEGFDQQELASSINHLLSLAQFKPDKITDESSLLDVVTVAVDDVLKHHIENRRWVDAFWDGARTIVHEGNKIKVPRKPKNETRIQPTLHVILDMALTPLGITVIRESDEGVGSLDFRCLFTSQKGVPLSVAIEFKLAHHKEVRKGIRSQLPAYLKAIRSKSGIFSIMWFKDNHSDHMLAV